MLSTVIIDDEAHIRDTLSKMLAKFCPQVVVAGEASGVANGIKAISELHPNLVFLDINMGDGNAFDLLYSLKKFDFGIIFISSFNHNAIKAMKLTDMEYLQKPFNPTDLIKAVKHSENADKRHFFLQLRALEENLGFKQRNLKNDQ